MRGPDRAADHATGAISRLRAEFERELAALGDHDQGGMEQVGRSAAVANRDDSLVQTAVQPDEPAARAEREPEKAHAVHAHARYNGRGRYFFSPMDAKPLRPQLDPETCSVCGRRLLQGENINWYVAPDSTRRVVCELCVPRAERARWVREREGEEVVQLRPARGERAGLMRRVADFFGATEHEESDGFSGPAPERPDQARRREGREARRRERSDLVPEEVPRPRDVTAIPTEPEARLERGLELFNHSQFPRTIAGLSRSLGDPQVAVANGEGATVDIWVGWDLAWYSYRVTLGDATEPIEQSGRGNDVDELIGSVREWNGGADGFGRLFLQSAERSDRTDGENPAS